MTVKAIIDSIRMEFSRAIPKEQLETLHQLSYREANNLYDKLQDELS